MHLSIYVYVYEVPPSLAAKICASAYKLHIVHIYTEYVHICIYMYKYLYIYICVCVYTRTHVLLPRSVQYSIHCILYMCIYDICIYVNMYIYVIYLYICKVPSSCHQGLYSIAYPLYYICI